MIPALALPLNEADLAHLLYVAITRLHPLLVVQHAPLLGRDYCLAPSLEDRLVADLLVVSAIRIDCFDICVSLTQ